MKKTPKFLQLNYSDTQDKTLSNAEINDNKIRISKAIAHSGYCSRRKAEELILNKVVKLNNKVVTDLSTKVDPQTDNIIIYNKAILLETPLQLWLFHKPKEVITSNNDPQGRKTIFNILPKDIGRVITIGRLDYNTEGLLLLTNNGDFARMLELPSNQWIRTYKVRAYGILNEQKIRKLQNGVSFEDTHYGKASIENISFRINNVTKQYVLEETSLDEIKFTDSSVNFWLEISIKEGKKREIRNMMKAIDCITSRLIRISYGGFELGSLPIGMVQEVSKKKIKQTIGHTNLKSFKF